MNPELFYRCWNCGKTWYGEAPLRKCSTRMTPDELKAIKARADAATPGPWLEEHDEIISISIGDKIIGSMSTATDAWFVARAREDVSALIAEIARLTARAEKAEASCAEAAIWFFNLRVGPHEPHCPCPYCEFIKEWGEK